MAFAEKVPLRASLVAYIPRFANHNRCKPRNAWYRVQDVGDALLIHASVLATTLTAAFSRARASAASAAACAMMETSGRCNFLSPACTAMAAWAFARTAAGDPQLLAASASFPSASTCNERKLHACA